MKLGGKSLACLMIAHLRHSGHQKAADALYHEACEKWSEKAIIRKFEELDAKGYIESGVSSRTGWLTDKGKAALGPT